MLKHANLEERVYRIVGMCFNMKEHLIMLQIWFRISSSSMV